MADSKGELQRLHVSSPDTLLHPPAPQLALSRLFPSIKDRRAKQQQVGCDGAGRGLQALLS